MSIGQYVLRISVILTIFLLVGCSSGGAFGTSAPRSTFSPLAVTTSVEQSRAVAGDSAPSQRVVADMQELARYQANSIYRIGPSDLLTIKVFQADELSGEVRVDQRGNISLPLIGNVRIAGLSQAEAEKRLADLLGRNYLQNPQVSIFIKEFTNQRVTVEGEVGNPGVYPIKGKVSLLQAIALAGGVTQSAKTDNIALFRTSGRGGARAYQIDLGLIRNGRASDFPVVNDDRIVVERKKKQQVTVEGEVNGPGVFTFDQPTTVLQAIALSRGLTELGAPDKVILFRRESNGAERGYSVNLSAIRQGQSADPYVQSGDRIVVHRSDSRYWLKQAATLLSPLNLLRGW